MKVKWRQLREVVTPSLDSVVVNDEDAYRNAGILNRGRGLFEKPLLAGSATQYSKLSRLSRDQLVYSKLFGWEGSVAVVPQQFDGAFVSSEFPTYDLDTGAVDPAFVSHAIGWEGFVEQMAGASSGLGQRRQRVNPGSFVGLSIPLPLLEDQRRIAAHLDHIDNAARQATARSTDAEAVLSASLEEVVSSLSGGRSRALGELLERDRTWIEINQDARYEPIGIRGFGRGLIRYPRIPGEQLSKLKYYRILPDRLLVSNIKAWEGAVAISTLDDSDRVGSNRFLQYDVTSPDVMLEWIRLFLVSSEGVRLLGKASPGSADRNRTLSMDTFEAIEVPVPTLEDQRKAISLAASVAMFFTTGRRGDDLSRALLPAARNEIFSAMR